MESTRQESDSLGAIAVDARRLWGAQTQRSLEHFAISTERLPPELVRALASVKLACAQVNAELGLLPPYKAQAIMAALIAEASPGSRPSMRPNFLTPGHLTPAMPAATALRTAAAEPSPARTSTTREALKPCGR